MAPSSFVVPCINFISKADIVTAGIHAGSRVLIPRIKLTGKIDGTAYEISRRQLPVRPAFAMTINKSQGQTLSRVGVYIPAPVFSHGQLYVTFSRVTHYRNLQVMAVYDGDTQSYNTKNIVYPEVLN